MIGVLVDTSTLTKRMCLAALVAVLASASATAVSNERPNIVLILADDIGYSDIGCFGGEIATPNLDRLAENGVRFTHFYNAGRCSPSRASLLTGLYPHQAGMGWITAFNGPPAYAGDLNRNCVTIAEVLRASGYRTYLAGKWDLTPQPTAAQVESDSLQKHNWPLQRGFDRFYGTIHGAGSYYDPATLTRDNELVAPNNPNDFYYTDAIGNNAVSMIREHNREQPFFLYMSFSAAHWPLHAKPSDIAKYKGRYDEGWDKIREQRLARLKELNIVGPQVELAPNVLDWKNEDRKAWQSARMEVYAAMIDSMDQGVGRVLEALRSTGQYDNTLILYLHDNGACQEECRSQQARQRREDLEPSEPMAEGVLQLAMVPEYTRRGEPVLWGRGVTPGPANTYMEVGREWANASNTPFRLFKHYVHEGGIATPLIAHWPKGIERRGELEEQPGHLIDIMPTLIQVAQAEYPDTFHDGDQAILPTEGVSLVPAFAGESIGRKEPLCWEHEGNRALRAGNWKLVARGKQGKWQLYNLKKDRSELNDLASDEQTRVSELRGAWNAWAARCGVLPMTPYRPDKNEEKKQEAKRASTLQKVGPTRR